MKMQISKTHCIQSGTSLRILLPEDDPEMARALLEALQRQDVLADHASTISDAEALALDGSCYVLVLDRRLPDGEGLNLWLRFAVENIPCRSLF